VVVKLIAADAGCGPLTARHTVSCAPCVEEADAVSISGPAIGNIGSQLTLLAVSGGADPGGEVELSWQVVSGPAEIVGSATGASATVRCLAAGDAMVEVAFDDGACGNVTRATHALACLPPPGGAQLPGDCNQDASLDIGDPICLFGFLFLGSPSQLPCEGSAGEPANLALLDANGDRNLDLTDGIYLLAYLFGGCRTECPPHVGGTECRATEGCPESCPDSP
jgi:hypothetical protein